MVNVLHDMTLVDTAVFGLLLAFAILATGYLADIVLGRTGFGTLPNGLLLVCGGAFGIVVRLKMLALHYFS